MKTATLGILTGISYVSGIDYFKKINEKVLADSPQGYIMFPNPPIVMVSIVTSMYIILARNCLNKSTNTSLKESASLWQQAAKFW